MKSRFVRFLVYWLVVLSFFTLVVLVTFALDRLGSWAQPALAIILIGVGCWIASEKEWQ